MQLWYSLVINVNFTFINKELCLQNNEMKGVMCFKMDVVTTCTIFSWSVPDVAFEEPALTTIWNCSQNDLTYVHDQNIWLSLFLTGRMFVRPNILRTLRRTMIRFLIELSVCRIWFGQSKLYFILNWLVMRCKLRPELAADAQQTAWSKMSAKVKSCQVSSSLTG